MFKNEEGFSLLELVVAVGVAGIIAAVALPTFAGLQDKATTTSATYAASASAAEALANSTMGLTGSASNNTGASSSSNYTAPSSSVVISSAEYTSINVGEWMTYTPTAPVGSSSTDVFTLMSEVGYTYPTKLAFFGMTLDKVLAVKNAIDNGATTVNVGTTPYTLKSILNFQDADGMKTVVNSSFGGYYWDSMFGGYVMSLYITDSYGTSNTTLSGSNVSIN